MKFYICFCCILNLLPKCHQFWKENLLGMGRKAWHIFYTISVSFSNLLDKPNSRKNKTNFFFSSFIFSRGESNRVWFLFPLNEPSQLFHLSIFRFFPSFNWFFFFFFLIFNFLFMFLMSFWKFYIHVKNWWASFYLSLSKLAKKLPKINPIQTNMSVLPFVSFF